MADINNKKMNNIENANAVRKAADIAVSSHNPYVNVAGRAVKGLDKITNGKSSDAFGKLAARNPAIIKKKQNVTNKLANSEAANKLGKINNSKKDSSNNNDIASQKLQNSKSKRGQNLWNSFKNNKVNKKEKSNEQSSDNQNETESTEDLLSNSIRKIRVKIMVSLASFFMIVIIFFAILFAIFGINIEFAAPSANQGAYGTEDFTPTYNEGTREYENEIKYYKKLEEVSKDFANEYGEELRTNYIHAALIYIFYQVEFDEDDYASIDQSSVENLNGIENNDILIDYVKMTNMVDKIVELMKPSDAKKNVSYEKHGEFYNNLKNSDDFKEYYKKLLAEKDIEEILDEIFDLANDLDDLVYSDETVITEETKVVVEKTTTSSTLPITDYISSSLYASNATNNNPELIKAYTIAYSTKIVNENKKLTIDSNTAKATNQLCSIKNGCSYDANGNLVDGPGERSDKNTISYGGKYYYQQPLSNSESNELNKNVNSVFGYVLVKSDGTYPNIDINKLNGLGGGTYEEILKEAYGDYKLKNIGEDSYILDGSYGTKKVLSNVIFYDQNNYGGYQFCHVKNETIKTSGCGTTAMAMVVSTYENNKKYDPVTMMNTAYNTGYCGRGIVGTSPGFFKKEADIMNYKYLRANKSKKQDLNLVLKHLSQGHLVISHMGPGHFTGGGHYMVLGGVDPDTKSVYVYDPYHAANSKWRKTGNGWYSFNDIIVKESFNYFYIIWKG